MGQLDVMGVSANAMLILQLLGCKGVKKETHAREKKAIIKLTARNHFRITEGTRANFICRCRHLRSQFHHQHSYKLIYIMRTTQSNQRKRSSY